MQQQLDEFTTYRLKRIAVTFCKIHKSKGRKAGATYLNTMNIKEEHYPIVRDLIERRLTEMGLSL